MLVPFSPAYACLALALPGLWLFGRALAHRLTRDLGLRAVLPIGLSIACWVVFVQLASLAASSFLVGFPLGTLLAAAVGVGLEIDRRRHNDLDTTGRAPSSWMWITAIATAMAISPAAFRFWFHDELLSNGHMGTIAQIQNGIFPPRHPTFPEYPFRYHYGFDLLAAGFSAILRVHVDTAIDVTAVVLWVSSWCLLWVLGARLIGRRAAWLTPFMTLFASGMPVACQHSGTSILPNLISECPVGKWSVNGPVITYFFQHPWALGIPVAVTAILVFTEREPKNPWVRFGVLAFLFGTLSFSEIVLFVTLLPSLFVAELWFSDRIEIRRAPLFLLAMLISVGIANLLGGFFVGSHGLQSQAFAPHAGFEDTPLLTLKWNAMTFGAMWITGTLGFLVMPRGRLLFGLLAGGSLLVVNSVRHGVTADIMKFATVVSLALGVLGSAAVARVFRASSPARISIAAILLASATWVGVLYPVFFALDLGDLPSAFRYKPDTFTPADVEAATLLRGRVKPGEAVYRNEHALAYVQWAGLAIPWTNWTTKAWGFPPEKIAARDHLMKSKPSDLDAYRAQGFRWLVLDENSNDDSSLVEASDGWISRGEVTEVGHFQSLRVLQVNR